MTGVAVLHAIDAYRNPSRYGSGKVRSLPEGMLDVIRIAAGDTSTADKFTEETQETADFLLQASRHYLLLLLLDPHADGARLLALRPGASAEEIKDHKRWILKWLHPDRNPSKWESSLFAKVSTLDLKKVAEQVSVSPALSLAANLPVKDRQSRRHHGTTEHRGHVGMSQGAKLHGLNGPGSSGHLAGAMGVNGRSANSRSGVGHGSSSHGGSGVQTNKLPGTKKPAVHNNRPSTGKPRWKMVLNIKPIMTTFGFAVGFLLGVALLAHQGAFNFMNLSGWLK